MISAISGISAFPFSDEVGGGQWAVEVGEWSGHTGPWTGLAQSGCTGNTGHTGHMLPCPKTPVTRPGCPSARPPIDFLLVMMLRDDESDMTGRRYIALLVLLSLPIITRYD